MHSRETEETAFDARPQENEMDDASFVADPALEFDPDALRERYRQERDKRLRSDGEAQYLEVTGAFAHYAEDDPYADPNFTREPLNDEIEIAVIGGGFSGLLAGARLREAGLDDFRIIEAGADFGGTWYWNRYPGAQLRYRELLLPAAA